MPLTLDELNVSEKALWEAFATGAAVDLRDSPERTVRATVLAALLLGAREVPPGSAPGVRLTGARITGDLRLTTAAITVPVLLEECDFDAEPNFDESSTRSLAFIRCRLPGFRGKLLRVDGQLRFNESTVTGCILLTRATITGELVLVSAKLVNPGDWALFAGGLTVESALFGAPNSDRPGAWPMTVEGGLRLVGARMLGGVFFDGVQIDNPGAVALQGDNMTIFGRMLCGQGFRSTGSVLMPRARVEGELSFEGAHLDGPVALSLNNTIIDDLNLRTAEPATGLVDLRHARCVLLRDAPVSWPAQIALDGFVYESIDSSPAYLAVKDRLRWLGREQDGFRPQPYEQLAVHYRRLGSDAAARHVLLAKQRIQSRERQLHQRIAGHLLNWTVGYGYRPWRAAAWLAVMLAVGTIAFSAWPPQPDGSTRKFDPLIYTLDLLLPISAFGLREDFAPVGSTRWLAYGLTAAGWLLATALIAGVTRALRRD
ncbi:oxidoreductase [Rhizocola hellebori]|uniref:Oxidoreductase n=1 Tax=Rhizocola hellebori TaxID=1392758 RepID=A0A8J3VI78_9ACTN|nr:oxidoreductase [Rhizocola hellebori]GIH06746.1 oxidoreductase [Rhizocola hellebori]